MTFYSTILKEKHEFSVLSQAWEINSKIQSSSVALKLEGVGTQVSPSGDLNHHASAPLPASPSPASYH